MKEPVRVHYIEVNVIVHCSHKNQKKVHDYPTGRTGVLAIG